LTTNTARQATTPCDKVCSIGCGVITGIGAVINTAKVEQGAQAIVFGLGGITLNVLQGVRLAGADMIIGVNLSNAWQMGAVAGSSVRYDPALLSGAVRCTASGTRDWCC
jgi:Zn-dependent alcohol dehydrogenase